MHLPAVVESLELVSSYICTTLVRMEAQDFTELRSLNSDERETAIDVPLEPPDPSEEE